MLVFIIILRRRVTGSYCFIWVRGGISGFSIVGRRVVMLWMLGFIIIRFRFIVGVGLMVGLLGRLIIRRLWFMINWLIGWFWVMVARLVVGFRRFVVTCLVVRFGWGITISTCTINGFGVVASAQVLIESCSMRTMESLLATIFVAEMVNRAASLRVGVVPIGIRSLSAVERGVRLVHAHGQRLDLLDFIGKFLQ